MNIHLYAHQKWPRVRRGLVGLARWCALLILLFTSAGSGLLYAQDIPPALDTQPNPTKPETQDPVREPKPAALTSAPQAVRNDTAHQAAVAAGLIPAEEADYPLPPELQGLPEVVEQRTANSATFALPDGTYGVINEDHPMHYQDASGKWRRIDPRFEATNTGWANTRNSFRTHLGQSSSAASLSTAGTGLLWEPQRLALVDGAHASLLAEVSGSDANRGQLSAGGQQVRYSQGWNQPGLAEVWSSQYGSVEYNLLLEKQPALPEGIPASESAALELQVRLRLLPDLQIRVDGQPITLDSLPLETNREIEFSVRGQDEQGSLLLQPPLAYESANPAEQVAGVYSLRRGAQNGELELGVRIPWEWVSAAERHYPLVLDPLFQMKKFTNYYGLMYTSPSDVSGIRYAPAVGNFKQGQQRLLMRFDLPSQPPGAGQRIERAYLIITPTEHGWLDQTSATGNVLLYEVTGNIWPSLPIANIPIADAPLAPGAQPLSYNLGDPSHPGSAVWEITDLVRKWYDDFTTNNGLLLRMQNEFCETLACPAFRFEGDKSWSAEEFNLFAEQSTPDEPVVNAPDSPHGGVRLMVYYSPSTLTEGAAYHSGQNPFWGYGGPPQGEDPYLDPDHHFSLPQLPVRWQALSLRGFGAPQGALPVTPENPGPVTLPLQGILSSSVLDVGGKPVTGPMSPAPGTTGFILLDGRNHEGASLRYKVEGLHSQDAPPLQYETALIGEQATLSTLSQVSDVETFDFESGEALRLFNLDLKPGTNTRVDISFLADNIIDDQYYNLHASGFNAWLFKGGKNASLPGQDHIDRLSSNVSTGAINENNHKLHLSSADFTPASNTDYALALTFDGPELNIYKSRGYCNEFPCPPEALLHTYTVRVRVTSCPAGQFATADGNCLQLVCPTTQDLANSNVYRFREGLALWSDTGWSGGAGDAIATNNPGVIPMIGHSATAPTIAVVDGTITYNTTNQTVDVSASGDSGRVLLVNCGTLQNPAANLTDNRYLRVFSGEMHKVVDAAAGSVIEPDLAPGVKDNILFNAWPDGDKSSLTQARFYLNPHDGRAYGRATLNRSLAGDDATNFPLAVKVEWSVNVSGWNAPVMTVEKTATTSSPTLASMIVNPGGTFSIDLGPFTAKANPRSFLLLRASAATVSLPAGLGGASRPVTALIYPKNAPVPAKPGSVEAALVCPGKSCMDLRAPNDLQNAPQYVWAAPDVHIVETPGTIIKSAEGSLEVFSVDHPYAQARASNPQMASIGPNLVQGAAPQAPGAISQQFSFDTFSGQVSVSREPCEQGGPVVTVVRGETQMTMPNIGDGSGPQNGISASYKICQTSLRQVSFQFYSSLGIPLGTTGMFLTGMGGSVDLAPDHTTITFSLDLQLAQGGDGGIWKGTGKVTIDTRGYFEFAAQGKILGLVNTQGKLWVAWEPLDIGFEASVGLGSWLTGYARAHIWQGQGWQNKYSWLPDNNEKHMAAAIGAKVFIEAGAAFEWWFISIPPFDITFGIEVAFGQFCTNSSCSRYEWGVKGKFTVVGYDVGLYYGFDDGFDFILGNDDHVLIDQYGGNLNYQTAPGAAGMAAPRGVQAAGPIVEGVSTRSLEVGPETEQLLVALGWQAGSPQLLVLDHNGQDVSTSPAYTVAVSTTLNSVMMGIRFHEPQPGLWTLKVANLQDGSENFKLIAFANKGDPNGFGDQATFLTPAVADDPGTGQYKISWHVPVGTPAPATISLYYHQMYINQDTDPVSYVYIPVPIVKNLPFTTGEFVWDTRGMKAGAYKLYAEVDDGVNDFPDAIPGLSGAGEDYCRADSGLPSERAFAAERFPGLLRFESAGTVLITDDTAPAIPTGLTVQGTSYALLARWGSNTEKDLAGYNVRWGPQQFGVNTGWQWTSDSQEMRISAVEAPNVRLGGVIPYSGLSLLRNAVTIQAIDANGNVSPWTEVIPVEPTDEPAAQIPLAPTDVQVTGKTATSVSLAWTPDPTFPAASYHVIYQRIVGGSETGEVASTEPNVTIPDLQTGVTYRFFVSAANAEGWRSAPAASVVEAVVTGSTDTNGNDLPDDWEGLYFPGQTVGKDDDPDLDGLSNSEELALGTDPTGYDSDLDGYSDWEEVTSNTAPLATNRFPAAPLQPRLEVGDQTLSFHALSGMPVATQIISYTNTGGGSLALQAVPSDAWLNAVVGPQAPGSVEIGVSTSTLAPGFYSGVVRLEPQAGSDPVPAQCVRVNVWVSPQEQMLPGRTLLFPLLMR